MSRASDLAWASRTGGRLSRLDVATLVVIIAGLRAQRWVARRQPRPMIEPGNLETLIRLPDTSIVLAALQECRSTCTPAIATHCLRTFAFGSVLGAGRGLSFDREAFAVAALLHDIEIGRIEQRSATGCACFACAGARRAESFALSQGKGPVWARRVGDAIAMHLDPMVPLSRGVEAHLLQVGAATDVIGVGLGRIAPHVRIGILEAYPRGGFKRELLAAMAREAEFGQRTRLAFLMSRGFGRRVVDAPLP